MAYTTKYITGKEILEFAEKMRDQIPWLEQSTPGADIVNMASVLAECKEGIIATNLAPEVLSGLRETNQYYANNFMFPSSAYDYGLIVAAKDGIIIGSIWIHFTLSQGYATIVGIRSSIPYLLARRHKPDLVPLSSLLIPRCLALTRDKGCKKIICDPMNNMAHILSKHYGFKPECVAHDVSHIYGLENNFSARLTAEQIAEEMAYSAKIGEVWDDDQANIKADFYIRTLD